MTLGRNEPCPCGSGRKYKKCCMRKFLFTNDTEAWKPFIEIPITVQMLLEVTDDESNPDGATFWPLHVIGTTLQSVNFTNVSPEIRDDQLVSIGFCNRQHRLLVQVRTSMGTFSLRDQSVLPEGIHSVHVVVCDAKGVELYVDGSRVGSTSLRGSFVYQPFDEPCFGSGERCVLSSCVFRRPLTSTDISNAQYHAPPVDTTGWLRNQFGISRLYLSGENGDLASVWHSRNFVADFRGNRIVARILHQFGDSEANYKTKSEAAAAASFRISEITDQLQVIVDDPNQLEPELLAFFRSYPAAAFLLEPSTVRQWRESPIQNYGRIDFVFEKSDGSFVAMEIENGQRKLFNKKDDFSAELTHAIGQVERWLLGVAKSPQTTLQEFGVAGAEMFHGIVVIGRSSQLNSIHRRERWHRAKQEMELYTWDDIVLRGREFSNWLKDPELRDSEWQSQVPYLGPNVVMSHSHKNGTSVE